KRSASNKGEREKRKKEIFFKKYLLFSCAVTTVAGFPVPDRAHIPIRVKQPAYSYSNILTKFWCNYQTL
ncbi:MAG: hypothetical protein LBP72_07565, partial [Dysgonamonadaceae bacterium]|nr:hypothetical protein [Dysgonamonadaceae bacterium]